MKLVEKLFWLIVLLAFALKLFVIPGGGILSVVFLSLLSILYLTFGFLLFHAIRLRNIFKKETLKGVSAWRIFGSIVTGFGLSAVCIGILFKVQYFPGASLSLFVGLFVLLIVLVISVIRYQKNKSIFYKRVFIRIGIIGGFGLILFLTSQKKMTRIIFRNYPAYIEAHEAYLENPQDEELAEKDDTEYHRIIFSEKDFKGYMEYKSRHALRNFD